MSMRMEEIWCSHWWMYWAISVRVICVLICVYINMASVMKRRDPGGRVKPVIVSFSCFEFFRYNFGAVVTFW